MQKEKIPLTERIKKLYWVFVYGCIWGLAELTLGGFLHSIHHPQKGNIMAAVAYTIMLTYLVRHKNIVHPFFVGIIAACFKFFNVFIFGVPIFHRSIVNPALAIIAEAASVTLGAFIIVQIAKVLKPRES